VWDAANQCVNQDPERTAKWITTFIGLAGALAGAAVAWFNNSSAVAKRMRVYQEASDRVSFWDGWLKDRVDADASEEEQARLHARIEIELCVALAYVEAVIRGEKARAAYHVERLKLAKVRQLFLLYRPSRRRAWAARIVFFLLLIAVPVYFIISQWTAKTMLSPYLICPTLILLAWLFQGISILLEKPNWNDRAGRYIEIDKLRAE
jgi:hypothetical protein